MFTSRYDQCSGVSPDFLYCAAPIVLSISLSTETPQSSTKANYQMKNLKLPLVAVAGLAAFALVATSGGASASHEAPGAADVFSNTVFAGTYVSTGATSSQVNGDVVSGTYLTLGATSTVTGDTSSGTALTYGAGATILGTPTAMAVGNTSPGATELSHAQTDLNLLTVDYSEALGDEAAGRNYVAGVYDVTGLRTYTANTVINIDARNCEDFVLNASGYITFGAGVIVNHDITGCATVPQVFWNAGGYISIGAGADILGTVIAKTYVSLGANASVSGANSECGGGVYSQSSYVSIGAGATVSGGGDCTPVVTCDEDLVEYFEEQQVGVFTSIWFDPCSCEFITS
jgi:hypothetical protein